MSRPSSLGGQIPPTSLVKILFVIIGQILETTNALLSKHQQVRKADGQTKMGMWCQYCLPLTRISWGKFAKRFNSLKSITYLSINYLAAPKVGALDELRGMTLTEIKSTNIRCRVNIVGLNCRFYLLRDSNISIIPAIINGMVRSIPIVNQPPAR